MNLSHVTGLDDLRVARMYAEFGALRNETPADVQLTATERSSLNTVGDARGPFIIAAENVTKQHHVTIAMAQEDLDAFTTACYEFKHFSEFLEVLESFVEAVKDTKMLLGAICYEKSRLVRDLVELAIRRGKPGMETVYDSLSHLWNDIDHSKDNVTPKDNGINGGDANGGNAPA